MFEAVKRAFRVVHEGNTYIGSYSIHKGLIKVEYKDRSVCTRLGQHDPIVVADILLLELVKYYRY